MLGPLKLHMYDFRRKLQDDKQTITYSHSQFTKESSREQICQIKRKEDSKSNDEKRSSQQHPVQEEGYETSSAELSVNFWNYFSLNTLLDEEIVSRTK